VAFILGILPIALQLLLVIHVFKTGQDTFWIWILVFLPVAGGLAYLIVIVLPELRHSRGASQLVAGVDHAINPTKRLKELETALRLSDTVANRLALADECLSCGFPERAESLYRECLQGMFRGDRNISLKLARTLAALERPAESMALLGPLAAASPLERVEDQLMLLLCEEKTGTPVAAVIEKLRRLFAGSRNLETGYHLVRILAADKQADAARAVVKEMATLFEHHRHFQTTMGKNWLKAAQKVV
jgi:hypothetical protein